MYSYQKLSQIRKENDDGPFILHNAQLHPIVLYIYVCPIEPINRIFTGNHLCLACTVWSGVISPHKNPVQLLREQLVSCFRVCNVLCVWDFLKYNFQFHFWLKNNSKSDLVKYLMTSNIGGKASNFSNKLPCYLDNNDNNFDDRSLVSGR